MSERNGLLCRLILRAPKENIVQNHLNMTMLNVFYYVDIGIFIP